MSRWPRRRGDPAPSARPRGRRSTTSTAAARTRRASTIVGQPLPQSASSASEICGEDENQRLAAVVEERLRRGELGPLRGRAAQHHVVVALQRPCTGPRRARRGTRPAPGRPRRRASSGCCGAGGPGCRPGSRAPPRRRAPAAGGRAGPGHPAEDGRDQRAGHAGAGRHVRHRRRPSRARSHQSSHRGWHDRATR